MKNVIRFILKSFAFSVVFSAVFGTAAIASLAVFYQFNAAKNSNNKPVQIAEKQQTPTAYERQVATQELTFKRSDDLMKRSEANMATYEQLTKREMAWIAHKEANLAREDVILAAQERQLGIVKTK
jgi:hypothetical protein